MTSKLYLTVPFGYTWHVFGEDVPCVSEHWREVPNANGKNATSAKLRTGMRA